MVLKRLVKPLNLARDKKYQTSEIQNFRGFLLLFAHFILEIYVSNEISIFLIFTLFVFSNYNIHTIYTQFTNFAFHFILSIIFKKQKRHIFLMCFFNKYCYTFKFNFIYIYCISLFNFLNAFPKSNLVCNTDKITISFSLIW